MGKKDKKMNLKNGKDIPLTREQIRALYDTNVERINIGDLCTDQMKIFGANNNLMRHIPAYNDGLKPVHRRILWSMYVMGAKHNGKRKKVVSIVGIAGPYHPHGETSIVDALVILGQSWSNTLPLVDGEGNYGSPDGDVAAAMRYIEARMSYYTWKCFFEQFDPSLVDMKRNAVDEDDEPEYLPAVYPNVLTNTTFGIGYGDSTGIPTYNFNEVIDLTIKLMEDPDHKKITLIPDSPTGAHIVDEGNFKVISETGKGKFRMRGQIDIDEERNALIIRSVPMQTNSGDIHLDIMKIIDSNDGRIPGFIDTNNDSGVMMKKNNQGQWVEVFVTNIEYIFKKEIDPYMIRETIYKSTSMESSYSINFRLVDDYQTYGYSIRSLLLNWIDFRRETIRRKYNHKLVKAKEEQHILDTTLMVVSGKNGERVLSVARKAKKKNDVKEFLMEEFDISSLQAHRISRLNPISYTEEAILEYKAEKEKVDKNIDMYNKIIRSVKKIDEEIIRELEEGKRLFGEPRRSQVISVDGTPKIRQTSHVVVLTLQGFIKKLPIDTDTIGFMNSGDYPVEIVRIHNSEDLMIFDETGKISKVSIHKLQDTDSSTEGTKLDKYCKINGSIRAVIAKPTAEGLSKIKENIYFIMITKKGIVKKSPAKSYINLKNELLSMIIKDGDELVGVKLMVGDKDILAYTNNGFGVRFNGSEVKETNRMTIGVKSIDLEADQDVVGIDIINEKDNSIFVLTSRGTGKKATLDNFNTMPRASKPLRITSLDSNEDVVLIRTVKGTERFRVYLNTNIDEINIKDVPELPRLSKGRKLISVPKGSRIIDIKEVK